MKSRISLFVTAIACLGNTGCPHQATVEALRDQPKLVIDRETISTRPLIMAHDDKGIWQAQALPHRSAAASARSPSVTGAAAALRSLATPASTTRPTVRRGDGSAADYSLVALDDLSSLLTSPSPTVGQSLANTPLFKAVMDACADAIEDQEAAATSTSVELNPIHAYNFGRVMLDTLDRATAYGAVAATVTAESANGTIPDPGLQGLVAGCQAENPGGTELPFNPIAQAYLKAYFKGKFVNRRGVKLDKPKIEGNKVDNATITAIETVLLEAIFDARLGTRAPVLFHKEPVYVPEKLPFPASPTFVDGYRQVDKPNYETNDNNAPTAIAFVPVREFVAAPSADPTNQANVAACPGVTLEEYEVIRMLSTLNGEVKKQISSLVFRLFGGVELSFVFGGHFAIGNNETLSAIVTTLIEVSATRAMEFKWSQDFHRFRYHVADRDADDPNVTLPDGKKLKLKIGDPFLAPNDVTENQNALGINRDAQQGIIFLIQYHKLLGKLVGA